MPRRLLAAIFSIVVLGTCLSECDAQQIEAAPNSIKVYFNDIHCESCAKKIRSRIFTVKNVSRVITWVKQDLALIEPTAGKEVSPKAIWEALEKGDFEISRMETPSGVITEKPQA